MITTIFFDWGGVIASDPGDDFLLGLLQKHGASTGQAQEIYGSYLRQFLRGALSATDFWQELRSRYNLTVGAAIADEFLAWKGLVINDAVYGLVAEAKVAGKQVALLTNVIEPTYNVLAKAGYYKDFDAVIASCKVGMAKPEPAIYELALERLNVAAEQSLFIDDKERNTTAAEELGFTTIVAKNPEQIVAAVRAYL